MRFSGLRGAKSANQDALKGVMPASGEAGALMLEFIVCALLL